MTALVSRNGPPTPKYSNPLDPVQHNRRMAQPAMFLDLPSTTSTRSFSRTSGPPACSVPSEVWLELSVA